MKEVLRIAMLAALALSGCRRPAPEDPWAWEKDPGLDPHPAGQTLDGAAGPALPELSFRLDPARGATTFADPRQAEEEDALYLSAARSGQAWAQTKLGLKYVMQGGDLARLGEGLRWLNDAAGQNDTEALRVLSALAAEGRGMDQSDKESYIYMRRAAELGSPEAQYEVANMLANGRGMPRDVEAALVWGRKAAEQGYAPAQF
ncbi:MAG: sel1 repeat family protein, partial [Chthoniobacterales bacterium]|nr:sel1 repeat family protein [Chthoniobacterales bacterium]